MEEADGAGAWEEVQTGSVGSDSPENGSQWSFQVSRR